ncbi:hypothetical protein F4779DRAFT_614420 [Xylariaceae sp. FL0662B]|nr:hypothetical protein F4779DRAFT_614420 [Xylariaceae sp. FL0662B]
MFVRNLLLGRLFFVCLLESVRACQTDEDCSLNGICFDQICQCDLGWKSVDCGRLDLQPAIRWTGYNYTNVTLPDYYSSKGGNSSWGGQIIRDHQDKKLFHLIVSQFARGCGLSGWRPFSTVVRAESKTGPAGPYYYAQELFGPFHHNPTTIWSAADRKYLIYSISVNTETPNTCKSYKWDNNISVSSAPDVRGPWTPFKYLISGTNPTPWTLGTPENPTSEMLLGVEDNNIYAATSFEGPYALVNTVPWNTSDYSDHWTEDPFLWRDRRGNWHILCHWMIDIAERGEKFPRVGGHMFSRNLTNGWEFRLQEVYKDGGRTDYYRRERPKIFFSDDGMMIPLYLVNGVQEFNTSVSYTLIQPIGHGARTLEEELDF